MEQFIEYTVTLLNGQRVNAFLMGVGYNTATDKFSLLFVSGDGTIRKVAHDQLSKIQSKQV